MPMFFISDVNHNKIKGNQLIKQNSLFVLPPPPSAWLKFQVPVFKLLQNLLCPSPFSMAKTCPPPCFVGLNLELPPPHKVL